jgi:hypothetical protein
VDFFEWERTVYPAMLDEAKRFGKAARMRGEPRICDLGGKYRTPSGVVLRDMLSAWEHGYDVVDPTLEIFKQIEREITTTEPIIFKQLRTTNNED